MSKPLDSVIALARFSLNAEEQVKAAQLLAAEADWPLWLKQVEQHGLPGIVAKNIEQYSLLVPQTTLVGLRALKMRHRLAAEARYKALQEIDHIFKEHNIPYIGLKGVCLMPMVYKQPELRPMRDMDLLIPMNCAKSAADCLRKIGFELPDAQPSKYMKDMHQLPNATIHIDGFMVSVELHHDGYTRETQGRLLFPDSPDKLQKVVWQNLQINAFEDIAMLDQVSRHTESMHPNALLKLINVMDVIGLAEHVLKNGNWQRLQSEAPDIINTLRCLHLYTPLPEALQEVVGDLPINPLSGVGNIMVSLRSSINSQKIPFKQRFNQLFSPSEWWMHLYYNVDPKASLFWVKTVRHPLRLATWLWRRMYSRILGG